MSEDANARRAEHWAVLAEFVSFRSRFAPASGVAFERRVFGMSDNPDETRAEVFPGKDGQHRFRLISKANGQIVSASEGYHNLQDALDEATTIVGADDVEIVAE